MKVINDILFSKEHVQFQFTGQICPILFRCCLIQLFFQNNRKLFSAANAFFFGHRMFFPLTPGRIDRPSIQPGIPVLREPSHPDDGKAQISSIPANKLCDVDAAQQNQSLTGAEITDICDTFCLEGTRCGYLCLHLIQYFLKLCAHRTLPAFGIWSLSICQLRAIGRNTGEHL